MKGFGLGSKVTCKGQRLIRPGLGSMVFSLGVRVWVSVKNWGLRSLQGSGLSSTGLGVRIGVGGEVKGQVN